MRALPELLFVEEKRAHMELQAAALLYHSDRRPRISGKATPKSDVLLPSDEPLDAATVAVAVGRRILAADSAEQPDIAALRLALDGLTARVTSFGRIDAAPLARGLALELAPVRVNAVSPGLVATPMWSGMAEAAREKMFAGAAERLPLRRIGEASNIASAVLFLACNPFSTGSTVADGGATIAA